MNTKYARQIVKDNNLDIIVRGRTNGIIKFHTTNESDLRTLKELLKGMGQTLRAELTPNNYYIIPRA